MHSVFGESHNLSQVKESSAHKRTIRFFIEEENPVPIHWRVVYASLLLFWGKRWLITMLSCTQHFYIAEVHSTWIHCWAIPNSNKLLRYMESYKFAEWFSLFFIDELYRISTHRWGMVSLITIQSFSQVLNIHDIYPVYLYCLDVLNLKKMLTYKLSY